MYTITLSHEQYAALVAAIMGGALQERHATLRAMLQHNRDHVSIACSYEREIEDLNRAAASVLAARSA